MTAVTAYLLVNVPAEDDEEGGHGRAGGPVLPQDVELLHHQHALHPTILRRVHQDSDDQNLLTFSFRQKSRLPMSLK